MGEEKRRKEDGTYPDIQKATINLTIDVINGQIIGNISIQSSFTNWLAIVKALSEAVVIAIDEHAKQMFEASKQRIVKATMGDIERVS